MQSIDPQTDQPEHLLCDHHALVGALTRVQQEDGASLPLLDQAACGRYLTACEALSYRPARPVVGSGDKEVHQDFAVCMDIAAASPLRTLATQLQALGYARGRALVIPILAVGLGKSGGSW